MGRGADLEGSRNADSPFVTFEGYRQFVLFSFKCSAPNERYRCEEYARTAKRTIEDTPFQKIASLASDADDRSCTGEPSEIGLALP